MPNSTNRGLRLAALAPLLVVAACGDGAGQPQSASNLTAAADSAVAETAASCASCHTGSLSLEGRTADEVAGLIRAIAAGDKAHPPVNLPGTDGDTVRALADALTGN